MKNTIKKIVNYAVQLMEPEEIILFGSMVNGLANVHSDVDLLIISDGVFNKKEASAKIKNFASQLSLKSDILIYSSLEFEQEVKRSNSFIKAAQKSGEIIYKKS